METLRENKTQTAPRRANVIRPGQVARYSFPAGPLPAELHPGVKHFLTEIRDSLREHAPPQLDAAVAYTTVSWSRRPREILLYAVGDFEGFYQGLTEIAEAIAPAPTGKDPVAPFTEPLTAADWRRATEDEDLHFQRIERRGILLFERNAV